MFGSQFYERFASVSNIRRRFGSYSAQKIFIDELKQTYFTKNSQKGVK